MGALDDDQGGVLGLDRAVGGIGMSLDVKIEHELSGLGSGTAQRVRGVGARQRAIGTTNAIEQGGVRVRVDRCDLIDSDK